jgi:hypothetical protein
MYEFVNVNPCKKRLGDCAVRALSLALNQSWYRTAIDLCIEGLIQCDMQDSNAVWGAYLLSKGFKKYPILDTSGYSSSPAPEPVKETVDYYSDTEFGQLVQDKPIKDVMSVMDELISVLSAIQPRLYNGVMRKLNEI